MRIRIRHPEGTSTATLAEDATVADLKKEITNATSLASFSLKYSYPPKDLDLDQFDGQLKLVDTGIKLSGEQLIVNPRDLAKPLQAPLGSPPAAPAAVSSTGLPNQNTTTPNPRQVAAPQSSGNTRSSDPGSTDPPEVPVPSAASTCVLRVMPDDNSCLFRAVSSAILGDIDSAAGLRLIIAQTIQSQPEKYTEAILERRPADYCRWIQNDDAWGGAIELSILSEHFNVEIASINVQDLRVDRFNEGQSTRCILVYSGIHYDVIALSPSQPPHTRAIYPPEVDVKVFEAADDAPVAAARELCRILQSRHYYTDTANFVIRCGDCGWRGTGQRAAQEHATRTGHTSFDEG